MSFTHQIVAAFAVVVFSSSVFAGPCDPGAGDCCQTGGNGTPGCSVPECCNQICAIDPFCCDVSWDGICADEACDLCDACFCIDVGACCLCDGSCQDVSVDVCVGLGGVYQGDGTSCANVGCSLGCGVAGSGDCCQDNGTCGCDDAECCAAVCAVDPFCCDISWDGICAGEAEELCPALCGPPCFEVIEEEIVCQDGGGTFTYTVDGIDSCTGGMSTYSFTASGGAVGEELCFTLLIGENGFCCMTELCVIVPDCVPVCGDPKAGDCCFSNGTPGCDNADCCNAVCAVDPFCCDIAWDSICAAEVLDLCGDICAGADGLSCPTDLDADGAVGIGDFLIVLGAWGGPGGDTNRDGTTDISDFLAVLGTWGPCP